MLFLFVSIPKFEMPAARRAEAVLEEERRDSLSKLYVVCVEHISPARSEGIARNKDRGTRQDTYTIVAIHIYKKMLVRMKPREEFKRSRNKNK
jgi:hypothetical protein